MGNSTNFYTVADLINNGIIEKPLDGNHGGTHPKGNDFIENGVPFIMASDLSNGGVNQETCKFISLKQAATLRKGFSIKGDVLISHKATIGRTALVGETKGDYIMLTPQVTYYRVKDPSRLNNKYLKYYFDSHEFQSVINLWAGGGSTRAYIGITDQRKLPIKLLPIDQQHYIAHILGTLDDKIELNRKMNETLEAMAQALFKSWFVDFDPVIDNALEKGSPIPDELQHRAEQRKKVAKENKHPKLPDEIRNLFPSAFTHTPELGYIPEGWEVAQLDKVITLIGGGTPKTSIDEYWNGEIPWFSVVDAPLNSEMFVIDTEKKITKNGLENSSTNLLRKGTTIISARGTVGKCALVGVPTAMNQSCYGIQGSNGQGDYFTYFTVRQYVGDLQQQGHGSVFNTITRDTFKGILIPYDSPKLTNTYDNLVEPFLNKILSNRFQNVYLENLRNTLLPKLISGELRIPDAETLIEDATAK